MQREAKRGSGAVKVFGDFLVENGEAPDTGVTCILNKGKGMDGS